MSEAPLVLRARRDELREQCEAFHRQHPEVWQLFEQFTRDRIRLGFEHYGVGAIWERIRWETDAGGDRDIDTPRLKLNNNFRAFYARRFERKFPEHQGFFRKRVQTSAYEPPREGVEYEADPFEG